MYRLAPKRCESAYCLSCGPTKLLPKREALHRVFSRFNTLLHVTLTFDPNEHAEPSEAYSAFQKYGVSKLRQKLRQKRHAVGHYFAAIHFKPVQLREEWFHVHVVLECSENLATEVSQAWPHGLVRPGRPGISPQNAANYVMRYALHPEYGWPDWFRDNRCQRYTCSKGLWSLDWRFRKQTRKPRKSTQPRPEVRRIRLSADARIDQCGVGAKIEVQRPGHRGYGEVGLYIADLADRRLAKSVLRGKTEFTPADLVNADLGTSPEEYYRKSFCWNHPDLPPGYMPFVPTTVLDNWRARCDIVITLSRLMTNEDWQASGYPRNPIDPERLACGLAA